MSDVSDPENLNPLPKIQQDINEAVKKGETNFRIQQDVDQIVEQTEKRLDKADKKKRRAEFYKEMGISASDSEKIQYGKNIKPIIKEKPVSNEEVTNTKVYEKVTNPDPGDNVVTNSKEIPPENPTKT
jgi:hypothetical protein